MKLNRRVRKGVHRDGFKHVHVDDVEAAEAVDQKNFSVSTVSLQNQSAYFNAIVKFLVFCAFCGAAYGIYMSFNGDWCRRTKEQITKQCNLMREINDILTDNNIESWLCYGSALAAYRENGNPIPWEIDDDICVFSSSIDKIEEILRVKSKELNIRVEAPDDFGVVALRVYFQPTTSPKGDLTNQDGISKLPTFNRFPAGEYSIDFYAHNMKTYWNKIKMVQNTAFVRDRYKRDIPLSTLKPFKIVQYCGTGTQFNIPGNISNYLSHLYGTGYKVPRKLVPSNGFRGWRCLISFPYY